MTTNSPKTRLSGLSRRSVLAGGAAFTGLAATGLSLKPARAQSRGGNFRVAKGHGNTTDTLNPATWDNGFMTAVSYGLNGHLTGFGRDGSIQPEIFESWEATPDAKTWRFKVRSGVTFHDGMTVTPEQIVTSINYHRGEDFDLVGQAAARCRDRSHGRWRYRGLRARFRQCGLPGYVHRLPHGGLAAG